ncbi:hypothetical protein CVT26_014664 [Gymnopilus dilepis]|uniref:Uncharacterized protein n=1 Tax=Gymnopilus dilepis TaxID=231916 RepID=A0A409W3J2_9AGAR|nr:hypothetical protein CVT26_014664 [Gymnopilus dilepis]
MAIGRWFLVYLRFPSTINTIHSTRATRTRQAIAKTPRALSVRVHLAALTGALSRKYLSSSECNATLEGEPTPSLGPLLGGWVSSKIRNIDHISSDSPNPSQATEGDFCLLDPGAARLLVDPAMRGVGECGKAETPSKLCIDGVKE